MVITFSKRRQTAHNILHLRIPLTFRKFSLCHFALQKDLPVFSNWKTPEKGLPFYEKQVKSRRGVQCWFPSCTEAAAPWASPSQELHQHHSIKVWPVSVGICALFPLILCVISKMCPKVIAFSLTPILANQSVHRSALLSDSQGNL